MQIKSASQIFQSADKLETVALTKKLMSEEDWWLMTLYLKPSTASTKASFTRGRAQIVFTEASLKVWCWMFWTNCSSLLFKQQRKRNLLCFTITQRSCQQGSLSWVLRFEKLIIQYTHKFIVWCMTKIVEKYFIFIDPEKKIEDNK